MIPNIELTLAHVKWFSDFFFSDAPRALDEIVTLLFIGFAIFTTVAIGLAVFIDRKLEQTAFYQSVRQWLEDRQQYSELVLRIGVGMTLLLAWQSESLLVPDLETAESWVGWMMYALALLLILPATVPLVGVGLILLYGLGVFEYGVFYMLDYLFFVGIGLYFIVRRFENPAINGLDIPLLYATVGFSLIWPGLEKLVYPEWSFYVLENNPQLTLGFPLDFFLTGAAFVELALGYLLLIGLMGRPLSVLITVVFFTTTMVFGRVEIIGHTPIHAALIVFLLNGPGHFYPAPIQIHKQLNWRTAFAAVNFVVIVGAALLAYSVMAEARYQDAMNEALSDSIVADCAAAPEPDEREVVLQDGNVVECDVVLEFVEDSDEWEVAAR
jgi:uncharacterized membrane protein YphA (DoxX/SURF4 family)